MKAQAIDIISEEPQEEMYFFLIPASAYRRVVEVAAKENKTVQQLIQDAVNYITKSK